MKQKVQAEHRHLETLSLIYVKITFTMSSPFNLWLSLWAFIHNPVNFIDGGLCLMFALVNSYIVMPDCEL